MFKFVPGLCELQIGHPGGAAVGAGDWLETARTEIRRFGMLSALRVGRVVGAIVSRTSQRLPQGAQSPARMPGKQARGGPKRRCTGRELEAPAEARGGSKVLRATENPRGRG